MEPIEFEKGTYDSWLKEKASEHDLKIAGRLMSLLIQVVEEDAPDGKSMNITATLDAMLDNFTYNITELKKYLKG